MRSDKVGFIAVLLAAVLFLGGCGTVATTVSVPKLQEPVAANAAYRPVELGVIGESKVLYGTVVPMEYCAFYDTSVELKEITVEVGDYVEEGDVVAYADVDKANAELESLKRQLEYMETSYILNMKITQLQIFRNPYGDTVENDTAEDTVSGNDVSGNDPGESEEVLKALEEQRQSDIAIGLENLHYDELLHQYRVEKLQQSIRELQEVVAEGALRAPHSGYVVYCKEMAVSTYVEAFENIVVLTDTEDTYLELTERTIDQYAYEDYEVKYLLLDGKRYNVTEMSYSAEAEAFAKANGKYPYARMYCPEGSRLEIGNTYPIFFREKSIEEVPVIGLDSLEGDKDSYFVYVRNEAGEREKRYVTIGETDQYYAQVLEGLQEGELVYYESEALMPGVYEEYEVSLTDYEIENTARIYQLAEEPVVWYDAENVGTITEIAVKSGEEVEAGDLLYVMKTEAGRAMLAAAQNEINQENIIYERRVKQLNQSLARETDDYTMRSLKLQLELADVEHAYQLVLLQENYNEIASGNDGSGKIYVYAKQNGTVTGIWAEEKATVSQGAHILSVRDTADDKLLVEMSDLSQDKKNPKKNYPDNIARFGEQITITAGGIVYPGHCIGVTAHRNTYLKKYYITEKEDDTQISFCTDSGYARPAFYVEMGDEFSENMLKGEVTFSYVRMENVVSVPESLIQEERNTKNPNRMDYYVWRVTEEGLIKQYVLINKEYSDAYYTLILSGVEDGDVLAWKK